MTMTEREMSTITAQVNGEVVTVPEGSTILEACRRVGLDLPTLCYGPTMSAANACRVCVVELEGSRALVPSCSRKLEEGMEIRTGTERAEHSRRLVLELLGSASELDRSGDQLDSWIEDAGAEPSRFGPKAATVATAPKIEDDLYVRDYGRCILCYRCVDACGVEHQNTFAIAVAGRGFEAHISTEFDVALPDSACVYCGNCIAVCPTGALVGKVEFDMRENDTWDESRQDVTRTVCSYCGVGCNLDLHTQDEKIVKVTSPHDHDVTLGNLCIKGRFGQSYVSSGRDG
ncbi:MAG: (2Fe-2S)-binding protein [Acidobacteria bacterium]|nr:(2Fe-2S)-binding protein [Acidobacteriota bacterium]TDI52605.1 MAG: 4Fe-4S dicluster domain-containing protein [Acidobacteriota bacterium]TDI53004.1 MAG: 4Fe-4S dicluster domain-containing protein [Acidobacteriota bacterium]TDI56481.1 MAG: 4Fe-4S dicluster domain-containing protein [Acidobacteriota bacterium]